MHLIWYGWYSISLRIFYEILVNLSTCLIFIRHHLYHFRIATKLILQIGIWVRYVPIVMHFMSPPLTLFPSHSCLRQKELQLKNNFLYYSSCDFFMYISNNMKKKRLIWAWPTAMEEKLLQLNFSAWTFQGLFLLSAYIHYTCMDSCTNPWCNLHSHTAAAAYY